MKEKLLYGLYMVVVWPLALLPFWALYLLSDFFYLLVCHVFHYRSKVVDENLASVFPEKSDAEREAIKRGFYRNLCDIVVESVKLLHVSDRTLRKRIHVTNPEVADRITATDTPIILFVGHYGNWEWIPAITLYFHENQRGGQIYKPLRDKAADRLIAKVRSRFDAECIPQARAVRTLLAWNRESRRWIVGFVADHRSNSDVSHQRVEFLNHMTPYNVGGETIGDKIGARYLYLDVYKRGRGRYDMTYIEIDPAALPGVDHPATVQYYKLLEKTILRQPSLWLWSHRRWLYK